MARITAANRAFYLDILREQTGLNLTISSAYNRYVLTEESDKGYKELSRYCNGTEMYEIVFAMTQLMSAMKVKTKKNKEIEL